MDVINCAKFYRNRLRGLDFGFYEWSKFDHFHWIAMSPLTLVDDRPPVITSLDSVRLSLAVVLTKTKRNAERLPYWYCSKNVSGYRRHRKSVVAYSAEVAHRALPIR